MLYLMKKNKEYNKMWREYCGLLYIGSFYIFVKKIFKFVWWLKDKILSSLFKYLKFKVL